MMKIKELLDYFDEGRPFGDDPAIILAMRAYIQENRRLLFEMNNVWHEDPNEITELRFIPILEKTLPWGTMSLLTPAASSRIREAS